MGEDQCPFWIHQDRLKIEKERLEVERERNKIFARFVIAVEKYVNHNTR
jgi:hypothetical protein